MILPETGLKAAETEFFAFLDRVYDAVVAGETGSLLPDPFHPQNAAFTDELVAAVIRVWEIDICEHELKNYPGYHYNAQGVKQGEELLVRTGWDALPEEVQLYIVQGIWDILNKHRTDKPKKGVAA